MQTIGGGFSFEGEGESLSVPTCLGQMPTKAAVLVLSGISP